MRAPLSSRACSLFIYCLCIYPPPAGVVAVVGVLIHPVSSVNGDQVAVCMLSVSAAAGVSPARPAVAFYLSIYSLSFVF